MNKPLLLELVSLRDIGFRRHFSLEFGKGETWKALTFDRKNKVLPNDWANIAEDILEDLRC